MRPNILLILSDQMVAALTGAYGHPVVRTPHLDRLAERACATTRPTPPFPSAPRGAHA